MTDTQRALFEQAAYQKYLDNRAAGMSSDGDEPAMAPDGLFWRQPDDTYGVLMFNAAWWGWQASRAAYQRALVIEAYQCC